MDPYHRGRSPSAGASQNIRRSRSPSPNPAFTSQANAFGFDPALLGPATSSTLSDSLSSPQTFQQQAFSQALYSSQPANSSFHSQGLDQPSSSSFAYPDPSDHIQQALPSQYMSQPQQTSNNSFAPLDNSQNQFGDIENDDLNQDFDPSLYLDFDQPGATANDSANYYAAMPTTLQQSPEAPHLLQPDMRPSIDSSVPSSSSYYQDALNSGSHSRHTSLSPSSAAYMQGNGAELNAMSFQGHRRLPSDQHSDISSSHPSPYLQTQESFDGHSSPMLNGAHDPSALGPENLGLGHFSLSDAQHISPGHSSHQSPNLGPQQMPLFNGSDGLGMLGVDEQYNGLQGQDSFTGQEDFPLLQPNDSYQSNQMSPPEIIFEPAPPSKQASFNDENPAERAQGALSPPDRSPSRNRQRSRSDPYSLAASGRGHSTGRARSPSDGGLHPGNNLSAHSRSRSTSPSGPTGGVQKYYRRSSSPAAPASADERSKMLERAQSPHQPPYYDNRATSPTPSTISNISNDGGAAAASSAPRRAQRHPATFQCNLCPKRFTRAYNLRSHTRTHTDERPFVCTVCGKAFARQHDRKRHEGLHSGEKRFVCRGILNGPSAGPWGCGRKFARADALGRHFRSEAGRSCIKPLLDEEARNNSHAMMAQGGNNHGMMHGGGAMLPSTSQPQMMPMQPTAMGGGEFNGMVLPEALLNQFPALRGISWDALPPGVGANMGATGSDMGESDNDGVSDYGNPNDINDFSAANNFDTFEEDETGYKSDAGYGPSLDPSFQNNSSWQIPGGMGGPNGYYSDRGQQ